MTYLLDTNIVSEATKREPAPALMEWLGKQPDSDLFICTLTLAEIARGILEKPPGRKRRALDDWFRGPEGPPSLFRGRILSVDEEAGTNWARLMATGTGRGRPRSALDMIIAAIAVTHDFTVVTSNERHYVDVVPFLNTTRPVR